MNSLPQLDSIHEDQDFCVQPCCFNLIKPCFSCINKKFSRTFVFKLPNKTSNLKHGESVDNFREYYVSGRADAEFGFLNPVGRSQKAKDFWGCGSMGHGSGVWWTNGVGIMVRVEWVSVWSRGGYWRRYQARDPDHLIACL